jgi:hypothetical protein
MLNHNVQKNPAPDSMNISANQPANPPTMMAAIGRLHAATVRSSGRTPDKAWELAPEW